jgi:hypothetical protein
VNDLIARVRGLLLKPKEELPKTLADSGELRAVLVPYVLVLAAIGPVAGFLSAGIIGTYIPATTIFNTTIPASFIRAPGTALVGSVLRYGLGVAAWVFFAWILNVLSPSFGGRSDKGGALKAAAAAVTPMWVAGALGLLGSVPFLGSLAMLGGLAALVYGVLIGMWAVPLHLGVPEPKAVGHVLAAMGITAVAVAITYWVLFAILLMVFVGVLR